MKKGIIITWVYYCTDNDDITDENYVKVTFICSSSFLLFEKVLKYQQLTAINASG